MRNFISVKSYFQGYDILNDLTNLTLNIGKNPIFLGTKEDFDRLSVDLISLYENSSIYYINGPCSYSNFSKIIGEIDNSSIDFVIGLGGGKSIDISKAIAFQMKIPLVIIPTIASTDGPCSSLVAVYDDSNCFLEYLTVGNPNMVVVDSKIIFNAPKRFLLAGIGDAISTYFEASINPSETFSKTALGIAKLCYSTIEENYQNALESYNLNYPNTQYEDVIESILLMSCIGFENTRLHLAHFLANSFNSNPCTNSFLHGEKVALGTLIQLKIYNDSKFEDLFKILKALNLPTKFSDIGFQNLDAEFFNNLKSNILGYDRSFNISEAELDNKLKFFL